MFGFSLTSWRSKSQEQDDLEAATDSKPKRQLSASKKKLHVDTSIISAPIPHNTPNSLTGFDVNDTQARWPPQASPTSASPSRAGPSNIAWLRKSDSGSGEGEGGDEEEEVVQRLPILEIPPPPEVVRLDDDFTFPLTRSMSSPTPYTTSSSSSNSIPGAHPARCNFMNSAYAGSTHSLRLDTQHRPMLSYGSNHSYPLMKPLSPIVEQDYISPSAALKTIPLPSVSPSETTTTSTPQSATAPAPSLAASKSTSSDLSHSPGIISASQSEGSNVPQSQALLRPKKSCPLPTISAAGSSEEDDDHASFVTASDSTPHPQSRPQSRPLSYDEQRFSRHSIVTAADTSTTVPIISIAVPPPVAFTETEVSIIRSDDGTGTVTVPRSPPSASESFVLRRWERDAFLNPPRDVQGLTRDPSASSSVKFRVQAEPHWWNEATPAFWAFWMGFLCPILWLIGGWHFTHFGEQPPRVTFWEFYLNLRFWKGLVCCGGRGKEGHGPDFALSPPPKKWTWGRAKRGRKDKEKQRETETGCTTPGNDSLRLPRWVSEKQSSDFRRARLNDPKRSLKGIYFGYPFVARPQLPDEASQRQQLWDKAVHILTKPNKAFDHIYGVKLTEVHGKPEAGRRMIDPWIQRCRYAFCYGMLLVCAGLATGTAVLLIYNTRDLS
ncbi:hypothetical protein V5O48_007470 [Marasmius crinis-equi]|uniref:Uncharacterized protein n=1 Tax=Marasmius crinis-equi TaxID=585013 RepID=A0ABR3FGP6_9AGAR